MIITPTGTGWVDPAAIDSLEYLQRGDVASVAMQYSYLSSPLTLFVDPDYGADSARALFSEIYGFWSALPKDHRPRLYLHGLSLGAMNSEQSNELFEVLGDPYDGALWSGPPYPSRLWRSLTAARNPGTPAWLPTVSDGHFVRFMNQDGTKVPEGTPWGPMRVVYLQYASDAITFFDYHDFYRPPEWLDPARSGCFPAAHLVSNRHRAPARRRYRARNQRAGWLRTCFRPGALHRCVDSGNGRPRLVLRRNRSAQAASRFRAVTGAVTPGAHSRASGSDDPFDHGYVDALFKTS